MSASAHSVEANLDIKYTNSMLKCDECKQRGDEGKHLERIQEEKEIRTPERLSGRECEEAGRLQGQS